MSLLEQYIDDGELLDVALALKFLSDLCADGGDGDVEGVDLLDLRDLGACKLVGLKLVEKELRRGTDGFLPFAVVGNYSAAGVGPVEGWVVLV